MFIDWYTWIGKTQISCNQVTKGSSLYRLSTRVHTEPKSFSLHHIKLSLSIYTTQLLPLMSRPPTTIGWHLSLQTLEGQVTSELTVTDGIKGGQDIEEDQQRRFTPVPWHGLKPDRNVTVSSDITCPSRVWRESYHPMVVGRRDIRGRSCVVYI